MVFPSHLVVLPLLSMLLFIPPIAPAQRHEAINLDLQTPVTNGHLQEAHRHMQAIHGMPSFSSIEHDMANTAVTI